MSWFMDLVGHNQFLSGGLVLAILGGIAASARMLPKFLWERVLAHFTTVIDVVGTDHIHDCFQRWLAAQPSSLRSGLLSVTSKSRGGNIFLCFTPAPGTHWLQYEGKFVVVSRKRKEKTDKDGMVAYAEITTIRFCSRDRDLPKRLLMEAYFHANPPDPPKLTIWASDGSKMNYLISVDTRPLESITLPQELSSEIQRSLETFLSSQARYEALGIPYHYGLLFQGPPGNGKTSMIRAIGSHFKRNVCLLNFQEIRNETQLRSILGDLPRHPLLVIEDVDRNQTATNVSNESIVPRLELSAILNTLDGITTPAGMIVIMTANHPERLDRAMVRPGRIDGVFEFPDATYEMAGQLYTRFFPDQDGYAIAFAEAGVGFSMATLQGHLMRYQDDAYAAATSPISTNEVLCESDR